MATSPALPKKQGWRIHQRRVRSGHSRVRGLRKPEALLAPHWSFPGGGCELASRFRQGEGIRISSRRTRVAAVQAMGEAGDGGAWIRRNSSGVGLGDALRDRGSQPVWLPCFLLEAAGGVGRSRSALRQRSGSERDQRPRGSRRDPPPRTGRPRGAMPSAPRRRLSPAREALARTRAG